jgi:hypothetical protein
MANWTFEWILCILLTQQEGAKNLKVGDASAVWFFSIGRAERLVRFPDGGKCIALATRQRVLCRWVLCQCSSDGQTLHTGGRSQLLCCCELESGTGRQFVFFSLSTERAVETIAVSREKSAESAFSVQKRIIFRYTEPITITLFALWYKIHKTAGDGALFENSSRLDVCKKRP